MESSKIKPKIAIIGAGISGIVAGRELLKNGFADVTIFEASDRIGGRIHTMKLESGFIELGAQWIHGDEDNSVFEFASSKNLANLSDCSVEGKGTFCFSDDCEINCQDLVDEMIAFLDYQKNNMTLITSSGMSVHEYFESKFEKFLDQKKCLFEEDGGEEKLKRLQGVFRWFIIFELIDNSCSSLRSLSPLSYTEWEDCGDDLINPLEGYHRILECLLALDDGGNVRDLIRFNTPVESIDFNCQTRQIVLSLAKHSEQFDHVIVTCSLGFLKENLNSLFAFPLPEQKRLVIEKLGFGTMNKVFLQFREPFWNEKEESFQLVWSGIKDQHSFRYCAGDEHSTSSLAFPEWVYSIQSFDRVRGQPNMLMAWVGSQGAIQMEQYSDDQIAEICYEVLCSIIPESSIRLPIGRPEKVYASRWHSNPFMRGSYSNRTLDYERLQFGLHSNIEALQSPLCWKYLCELRNEPNSETVTNQSPVVLFAGEATDLKYYSTTHGAFDSGVREAQRIVQFYSN